MEKEKFRLKHPEIMIVIFLVLVAIASASFAYACQASGKQDPGFYEIIAENKQEVKYYGTDFSFYYYFDGEKSITAERSEIKNYYSDELSSLYAITDEDNTYASYVSIGKINEHPNEEVVVSSTLYNILYDAYSKTKESDNYSIFATPLYAFWYQQFGYEHAYRVKNDPLNSETSRTYLQETADYINSRDNIDLLFIGDGKVKLTVSEAYLNYRQEKGITTPYMSLNVLRNAYILSNLKTSLLIKNYDKGFIVSNDGNVLQFNHCPSQSYSYYSVDNLLLYRAADIKFETLPSSCSNFRRFNLNDVEIPNYYYFTQDGVTYFRSLYLNISNGLENNLLLSSGIYNTDLEILDKAYLNNELITCDSLEEIQEYLSLHSLGGLKLALNLVNKPKIINITNSLKENINLNSELDYNLNII